MIKSIVSSIGSLILSQYSFILSSLPVNEEKFRRNL